MEMEEIKKTLDNVWLVCNLEKISCDDVGSEIKPISGWVAQRESVVGTWNEDEILDAHIVDKSMAMVRVAVTFNILLLERKKGFLP